jgi:hypothetical protein
MPSAVELVQNGSAGFEVVVNTNQRSRRYTIEIVGRSGGSTAFTRADLTLDHLDPANQTPYYALNCPYISYNSPIEVAAGSGTRVNCSIDSMGGYTGPVTIECVHDGRVGCRAEGSPIRLVANGTTPVALLVDVPSDAQSGKLTIRLRMTAPGEPSSLNGLGYGFHIWIPPHNGWFPTPPVTVREPSFVVLCPFGGFTTPSTEVSDSNCVLLSTDGFTGVVGLSTNLAGVSVAPSVAISPTPPSPIGYFAPLRIDGPALGPGTHTVIVSGTSGSLSKSAQMTFTVA